MSKTPIPIQPIDFDLAERAVDHFATARDIPSLAFPSGQVEPARAPAPLQSARLNLQITADVMAALKDRAHADNVTIRAIVLRALHAAGLPIPEQDLGPDGRRSTRGNATRERR